MESHNSSECEGCKWHEEYISVVMRNTVGYQFDKAWEKGVQEWHKRCPVFGKVPRVGNGKPKGLFAGTLTKSTSDLESEDDMVKAIGKIMAQKTCPVKRYAWYLEYTKADVPHIHFIYETDGGGRIHQKVFKRYWKNWDESLRCGNGFRGGFHKPVQSEIAYTEYIAKDANIKSENKWDV